MSAEADPEPPAAAEVGLKAYPEVGLRAIFQTKAWAARTVDRVRSRVMQQKIESRKAEKYADRGNFRSRLIGKIIYKEKKNSKCKKIN